MLATNNRKPPGLLGALLIGAAFGALVWLERRRPLRREVEPKLNRSVRNLAIAAVGGVALQVVERPITRQLTRMVQKRSWGVLKCLRLPKTLETALALLLLDYTLYIWHWLTHRVPFLWRFHEFHHIDPDLDASTALRFHFGELIISIPWRAAQIILIGVSPEALNLWQTCLLLSIVFHHSNVRLPIEFERQLNRIVVTPRMHGIHHSIVEEETNSNWSSGLTAWDWLHRTLRLNVPQDQITIGAPPHRNSDQVTLLCQPRSSRKMPDEGKTGAANGLAEVDLLA
jgi:sterol desaturase/sphingolipid hydroxylase (fatty acid hydroxylase superfamily)